MKLRNLQYFIAVAKNGSFSKAAKELHISQPPLSNEISVLERQLHVKLIDRTTRPISLTEAGAYFYKKILQLTEDLQNTCNKTQQIFEQKVNHLTVAFTGPAIFDILPSILMQFTAKYPFVNIELLQMNSDEQIKNIRNDNVDIGLLCAAPNFDDLSCKILIQEPLMLGVPENSSLSKLKSPVELSKLITTPFIITDKEYGEYYHNIIEKIFLNNNLKPKIIHKTSDLLTAILMVKSNLGLTIVPKSINRYHLNGIKLKNIQNTEHLSTIATWKSNVSNPIAKEFIALFPHS